MSYITFHNHSCLGSLLDSTLKVGDLVKWAKANNMDSVGITDHGNINAVLNLVKECEKASLKPILGEEFYVTYNQIIDGKKVRDNHHLILLAKNRTGWDNLIKLHNISFRDDHYYYDPRITLEEVKTHKDGLVCTSACIGGVVGKLWLEGKLDQAKECISLLKDIFGEDFYLELQNHDSEDPQNAELQHSYNRWLIARSKEMGVKCIVQNDSHYYLKSHWEAHQVLLCKNTNSKLSAPKFKFDSKEYWLKNEAEMFDTFDQYEPNFIEECFANTQEIANKIEVFKITYDSYNYPKFGDENESALKLNKLVSEGWKRRFGDNFNDPIYKERLVSELKTIRKIGFVDYFLILDDLYKFTTSQNIYSGYGRGSAGGSLVLYCLGVTNVDPIRFNLLFERFINPDRISAPDVDCDFDDNDRPKVIKYLKERYGEDHVCNIATYGELTAKASFKAVASALEIPFAEANSITDTIDSNLSLEENFEQSKGFRQAVQNSEQVERAYKLAKVLEGTFAQRGTHACGMVISNKPLDNITPCVTVTDTKTKNRITATTFEMKEVDGDYKMLKLDILGLRNLGVIKEANSHIKALKNKDVDFLNLPLDDKDTYSNLCDGNTLGVFQFESDLMKKIIRDIQPNCIEDLSCITALARPGCLESGLTKQFTDRRQGKEEIVPIVEGMEQYMRDTLQLPIYQENCMQLSRVMAGYTAGESDLLRKCIGKKDPVKLAHERTHFVEGSVANGYTKEFADETFDIIEKFGGYGFNKSHALAYSVLSYVTAYYKTHYPVEFLCALLNSVSSDLDKLGTYIGEAFRLGIQMLPPDVNQSNENFTICEGKDGNLCIRFGLSAIKGLGKTAITDIFKVRKSKNFKNVEDFIERTSKVDKANLQVLLKVGAFDSIQSMAKKWDVLADGLADGKSNKEYVAGNIGLEEAIVTTMATKEAKRSLAYKNLASQKRELKSSKEDKIRKQQLTNSQENLVKKFIEKTCQNLATTGSYGVDEKILYETTYLGFNLSHNPYTRWVKYEKAYTHSSVDNIPFVKFDELINNMQEYVEYDEMHTVARVSNILIKQQKNGKDYARVTFEYNGIKYTQNIFASEWENVQYSFQRENMVAIVFGLKPANPKFSSTPYELDFISFRQLNVLKKDKSSNKYIVDIVGKSQECVQELKKVVVRQAETERENNLPIEKAVLMRTEKGFIPLCGLVWINNDVELTRKIAVLLDKNKNLCYN